MTCYHPLIRRVHLGEYIVAKDGHKYPKADIISEKCIPLEDYEKLNGSNIAHSSNYRYEKIPCRQCIGCRLDYSRDWATRCMFENKYYAQSWFITLTYDEEHIPKTKECFNTETGEIYKPEENWNGTLLPDHLSKFIKDIRRYWKYHFNQDNIRFFACGEYGSTTHRPHYHAILFNLNLTEDMLKPKFVNAEHQQIYECPVIEKIWGKGLIGIGKVSWSSCAYVARYITKKVTGNNADDYYLSKGQIPEFIRMSRMPGIGKQYFDDHKTEIYENDEVIQTTCRNNQLTLKPPKYYDKLFDIDYPEDMERIKKARRLSGKKATKLKLSKTTLTEREQLIAEEKTKLIKSKMLIRTLD